MIIITLFELYRKAKEIFTKYKDEYEYIGIRFENKNRIVGEECEYSRHNPERTDEREFPEFGTKEYEYLSELGGTSAWDLSNTEVTHITHLQNPDSPVRNNFFETHCYIIAGTQLSNDDGLDQNEIVIENAIVIEKLF